jgi:hypothetical protein
VYCKLSGRGSLIISFSLLLLTTAEANKVQDSVPTVQIKRYRLMGKVPNPLAVSTVKSFPNPPTNVPVEPHHPMDIEDSAILAGSTCDPKGVGILRGGGDNLEKMANVSNILAAHAKWLQSASELPASSKAWKIQRAGYMWQRFEGGPVKQCSVVWTHGFFPQGENRVEGKRFG